MAAPSQPEQQNDAATQWAYRAQKSIGLNTGSPTYTSVSGFDQVEGTTRVFQYSPDGSTFAAAMEEFTRLVDTREANVSAVKRDLPVPRVVDLQFSPKGSFLSTFERPVKLEDGSGSKNLKIWDTETGQELASFERKAQEGCFFQFTANESYCIRQVSTELQVYDPRAISEKGIVGRLRLEGMTSFEVGPGDKPSIAVFCGEKKGAPASVRIYPLSALVPTPADTPAPVSQKTFFKADKIQMKWNKAGTGLLFMTSTDHDKTGKSYYGETNLYMMSVRGDFDCRVGLDKEGPIHDFEWNPNGKEFIVIYGYMPAKATLFSHRVNVIQELGTQPRNFVAFNPQGRLFCIAGFGNLSGTVDIWDRDNLAKGKLFSMDASNSSVCQWSPDGHFILTATLSPRLRVENGVKIWHATGELIHNTPDIFKRVDEGGSGASTPSLSRSGSQQNTNGTYQAPGSGNRGKRSVPGAGAPPGSAQASSSNRQASSSSKKKGKGQQQANGSHPDATAAAGAAAATAPETPAAPLVAGPQDVGGTPQASGVEKKIRNLTKKLKAIEELKMRQAKGEKLEMTQVNKIKSEDEIRAELAELE
ncbi:uncharacterized protein PFL1_05650 [Pseudozyma flocculosa PF-1]|uniref:Eukaryotic translation initiation factor 2A n=1 Tax=Pseudozyma flocculosa PF-1 TaxID=1277687 RepID=A0A061H421_9BASI|nr:uncharacterized protein PFL1_05650 [Pseudozyma flocculosa PF-1]EPQ26670.1 hypothetical protein PFL1_05650 [Pseudozyma flocculosa PF-1]